MLLFWNLGQDSIKFIKENVLFLNNILFEHHVQT